MHPIRIVAGARRQMLANIAKGIRSHLWVHVAAAVFTVSLLLVGGGSMFWLMFRFLLRQEVFGPPLMERLVGVVLLAFFSMLVFSNLLITLTTTYISRDTEFLMGYPISHRSVFAIKLTESLFYSSWAFVLLSLPLFTSYGYAKGAPAAYYPLALLMGLPYLVIPASIGAVVTMVLSALLPAKRARLYSIGLVLGALAVTVGLVRLMGLRNLLQTSEGDDFNKIMQLLQVGQVPTLPHSWLASGLRAASEGQWGQAAWWGWCLVITAAVAVQGCLMLAKPLYYRGWVLAKSAATASRSTGGWSPLSLTDRLFWFLRPPVRALLGKDVRTFWRDPAQWSQLVILFGLMMVYIANIRGLTVQMGTLQQFFQQWPVVLSFFNLGATCFVICILTTRFIYPMLSLEGKQYWVVGLAPFPKSQLVWEKFAVCLIVTGPMAIVLIWFSNQMLGVSAALGWLGLVTVILLSLGLTSLAVGLGAVFPDFRQDNPARIANGLGGTLNIIISLIYIGAALGMSLPPTLAWSRMMDYGMDTWPAARAAVGDNWGYLAGLLAVHAVFITVPVWVGIRRWDRLEIHM